MKTKTAFRLVEDELERATKQFGTFHTPHEGFAVLQEEVDELWDEVKAGTSKGHRGISEAVQAAAMAIRFLIDLCDESEVIYHERKAKGLPLNPRPKSSYTSGGYSG